MIKLIVKKTLKALTAMSVGMVALINVGQATAEEFTDAQRNEIVQIFQQFFLENPEIIREALIALEQKNEEKRAAEIRDIIVSQKKIIENPKGLFVAGNPDGDVTLIEFFDYNDPNSKQSLPDILYLLENDPNLRVVLYETPMHAQSSLTAAHATLAAKKQGKYLTLHSALLSYNGGLLDEKIILDIAKKAGINVKQLKKDMNSTEIEQIIENSSNIAEILGVQGTPAFIIGDDLYRGAMGLENIRAKINEVRINR
uniref:DSBA-like thioredoxin domain-containing protein n=1 Tax=OCS116 cluster bacterium TaxID=2030921 RepID=A0A2A4YXC1_9PROT